MLSQYGVTEDTEKIFIFFGGSYRQRKTNRSLPEPMIHREPKAGRFSKIGLSRFLKKQKPLCSLYLCGEKSLKN
jgi:hypothetical protein